MAAARHAGFAKATIVPRCPWIKRGLESGNGPAAVHRPARSQLVAPVERSETRGLFDAGMESPSECRCRCCCVASSPGFAALYPGYARSTAPARDADSIRPRRTLRWTMKRSGEWTIGRMRAGSRLDSVELRAISALQRGGGVGSLDHAACADVEAVAVATDWRERRSTQVGRQSDRDRLSQACRDARASSAFAMKRTTLPTQV